MHPAGHTSARTDVAADAVGAVFRVAVLAVAAVLRTRGARFFVDGLARLLGGGVAHVCRERRKWQGGGRVGGWVGLAGWVDSQMVVGWVHGWLAGTPRISQQERTASSNPTRRQRGVITPSRRVSRRRSCHTHPHTHTYTYSRPPLLPELSLPLLSPLPWPAGNDGRHNGKSTMIDPLRAVDDIHSGTHIETAASPWRVPPDPWPPPPLSSPLSWPAGNDGRAQRTEHNDRLTVGHPA